MNTRLMPGVVIVLLAACGDGGSDSSTPSSPVTDSDNLETGQVGDSEVADRPYHPLANPVISGKAIKSKALVGRTYVIRDMLGGHIIEPDELAPMLTNGDIRWPDIAFTITGAQGHEFSVVGAVLDEESQQDFDFPAIRLADANFSDNPFFRIEMEGVYRQNFAGLPMEIYNVKLGGEFLPDLSGVIHGAYEGEIDPVPLNEYLGVDACQMIPMCNQHGRVPVLVDEVLGDFLPDLTIVDTP